MDQLFTTHDISRLLQVDPSTVSKWIDRGILMAFRTPGGHRRVRSGDLRSFLIAHQMPIPDVPANADDVTSMLNSLGSLTHVASGVSTLYEQFAADLAQVSGTLAQDHVVIGDVLKNLGDVLLRLNVNAAEHWNRPVRDFMTRSPETVEADARIAFAVHKMDVGGYRHLPVVSEGRIKGVISVRDILRYITEDLVSACK